jgi:ABC-type dipeptide/oligopeptide/nickel transport system permease subunit
MSTISADRSTTAVSDIGPGDPSQTLAVRNRSRFKSAVRAFRQDKAAVIAFVVLSIIVLLAILAPWLGLQDPTEADPRIRLKGLGYDGHILGLDYQGRDMLSRVIWGGRYSIPAAVIPVLIAGAVALVFGLVAGYATGIIDSVIMRVVDVLFAVPDVILAIAIAAALGSGFSSVVFATTLVIIAPLTRMAYASTRQQRDADYVLAARSIGAPTSRILYKHLLPNVFAPVLVYGTTIIGLLVVFTSTLSFLGLGVAPPASEWGLMVDEGRKVMNVSPHAAWIPGLAIGIVSLCFNLIGDGLRYALDPRQHRR